jgi:deoxyribonuclease-1-like protein
VQRILSLATLIGLGAAVWMFLSGGGLDQLAVDPNSSGQHAGAGGWLVTPGNGGGLPSYGPTPPLTSAGAQPVTMGAAAPPVASGPTIRMASFNIEAFGQKKLENPSVAYTLASIIQKFDVIAIQEIRTTDEYHMPNFLKLVNQPTQASPNGRRYDYVIGPRLGNTVAKEQYAFVFDTDKIMIDRQSVYTVGDPDNLLHREPHVATFATRVSPDAAFTFTLINVHTDPDVAPAELEALAEAYRAVRRAGRNEDDVIMLGDFNASDVQIKKQSRLGQIPDLTPLVRNAFSNVRQNKLLDNIVVHTPSTTEYVGRSGVYDYMRQINLSMAEAEQVSDHLPVWAEFSAYELDYAFRVVSRRTTAR